MPAYRRVFCWAPIGACDVIKLYTQGALQKSANAKLHYTTYTLMKPLPPIERIQELLAYNPTTGELQWAVSRGGSAPKGSVAGRLLKTGYLQVGMDREQWLGHRLCWALHYGADPYPLTIDHINRNKSDNRICNLRAVTQSVNNHNRIPTAAINKRRPVTITYADGGTITTRSVRIATYLLNGWESTIHRALKTGGILYNNNGRKPTGITIAYAE
jgi:hypothetical protein